jgi:hypothetical protein
MDKLIMALIPLLIQVESGGEIDAIGDGGLAVGILQIHPIVVDDVNRIQKTERFTYDDRYNRRKSSRMCQIYLTHYGQVYKKKTGQKANMDVLAAIWNGGPNGWKKESTKQYINKIKKASKK